MKRSYIIAGFAVSFVLLGWTLYGAAWAQVRLAFSHVRIPWVVLMAALIPLLLGLRAWRWTYLLRPVHPLGLGLCIRATGVGFLGNMLLPARAGEWVRAAVAGESGRVPASGVFATVVLERLVDALSFLPLMMFGLGWLEIPLSGPAMKASMRAGAVLFGLAAVGVGLVLWGLARAPERTLAFLRRALAFLPPSWLERLLEWSEAFLAGLRGVPTGQDLLPFLALTVAIWGILLVTNLCLFRALDVTLPLSAAVILQLMQVLGVSLPSAPGFVGTLHAATMGGLLLYGLPRAVALSAALVYHATMFVTLVLAGLGCLLAESMLAGRRVKLTALARARIPGPQAP